MVGGGCDLGVSVCGKAIFLGSRVGGNLCPHGGHVLVPSKADLGLAARWIEHPGGVPLCHKVAHVLALGPAVVVAQSSRLVHARVGATSQHAT